LLIERDEALHRFVVQLARQPFTLVLLALRQSAQVAPHPGLIRLHLLGHLDQAGLQGLNLGDAADRLFDCLKIAPPQLGSPLVQALQRSDDAAHPIEKHHRRRQSRRQQNELDRLGGSHQRADHIRPRVLRQSTPIPPSRRRCRQ
jgi:hypothetical protein